MQTLLLSDPIRAVEARGLASTPPGALMDRAAEAVAQACVECLRECPAQTPVLALVGPGNNGGDALLAALKLADRGYPVQAIALSAESSTATDASRVKAMWAERRLPLWPTSELDRLLADRPLVIDGLFGIGLSRALSGEAAAITQRLELDGLTVVAVDVPSGIDVDTGGIIGPEGSRAVRAALTVTMIADKPGLHTGQGRVHAGAVRVAALGLDDVSTETSTQTTPALTLRSLKPTEPAGFDGPIASVGALNELEWAASVLKHRSIDAHKGRFGDVLVLRGTQTMQGASLLAALGAQAVGAGRLFIGIDEGHTGTDPLHPELMTRAIDSSLLGEPGLGPAQAIIIGCGLGTAPQGRSKLIAALAHSAPLVVDADALNLISTDPKLLASLKDRAQDARITVLTPHPLEAARLLACSTARIQGDRLGAACELARQTQAIVVLKGAGSVIATPTGAWSVNASGGPILATAGTGDVLAGVIGGLLAQGFAPEDAASVGVCLHGAAGDQLAQAPEWAAGIGLPASHLPGAIRQTINRLMATALPEPASRSAGDHS